MQCLILQKISIINALFYKLYTFQMPYFTYKNSLAQLIESFFFGVSSNQSDWKNFLSLRIENTKSTQK